MRTILTVAAFALAGCAGGSQSAAPSKDVSAAQAPKSVAVTVPVAVITNNFLGQSCEALTGNFAALHTGAVVTLEDSGANEVGRARLGKPPTKPSSNICAWGGRIQAHVQKGETYRVSVGNRWSSKTVTAGQLIRNKGKGTIDIVAH